MTQPDLVAAASELAPELRARTAEVEAARRVPADLSAKVAAAGFYRAYVPASLGGLELHPGAANAGVEELARSDASVAWVAFIGMTSGSALAGVSEEAAREIFVGAETLVTGVFAPMGKAIRETDGYRATGRWAWGSGSDNADWILGGCRLFKDGEPELSRSGAQRSHMVLFPREDVNVLGNWNASGLCGSGSGEFEVDGVLAPERRIVGFGQDAPLERPLYQFPRFGLLALGIAAVALGTARAAIDDLVELASGKTPLGSRRPLAERPAAQSDVAKAEALLGSARLYFYHAIDRCYAKAEAGDPLPSDLRRDLRLATTHAVQAATEVVDRMYLLGGGSSVHRDHPLQRRFRDIHVATQHMMVAPPTLELIGKTFLGVDVDTGQL
jgi:alkylation response protein AidB-like acyl-CoA dehydrogenase